jgi:hypothetical protein
VNAGAVAVTATQAHLLAKRTMGEPFMLVTLPWYNAL